MTAHRSVSQLNQYNRCPYAYRLARIDKVWQRPAAWLPQGSAVHEAAEAYERSKLTSQPLTLDEVDAVYCESYANHVNTYCEITPDFQAWFRSGPYAGEADIERRFHIGREQVVKFVDWTDSHPEEVIWIAPDGTPGIELEFDIDLDGVQVRGFIDAVIETVYPHNPTGGITKVRDYKTGNKPGDEFQLAVYAVAISQQFNVTPPHFGDYWMGRTGKPTAEYFLADFGFSQITAAFRELEDNIQAGRFDPDPEPSKCRFCDVSASCEFSAV